jgi:hypothetical protein
MNFAEMAGLVWRRVNLSAEPGTTDGESLPVHRLSVRQNYYAGEFGSVKAESRQRIVPLPMVVIDALQQIKSTSKFTGPDDPVFSNKAVAPRHGFEPRFTAPKAAVLPLDDRGNGSAWFQSRPRAATRSPQRGFHARLDHAPDRHRGPQGQFGQGSRRRRIAGDDDAATSFSSRNSRDLMKRIA